MLIAIAVIVGIFGIFAVVFFDRYTELPHSVVPLLIVMAFLILCVFGN